MSAGQLEKTMLQDLSGADHLLSPPQPPTAAAIGAIGGGKHVMRESVTAIVDTSFEGSSNWSAISGQLENVMFQNYSNSCDPQPQPCHSDSITALELSKGSGVGDAKAAGARVLLIRDAAWSVRTEKHAEGTCTPCQIMRTTQGFIAGQDCMFFHLPHFPKKDHSRKRPCKTRREQCKKIFALVATLFDPQAALASSSGSSARRCFVVSL